MIVKKKKATWFLVLVLNMSFQLWAQDQWKNVYIESAWAERDEWQKAGELIRQLSLKPGNTVADIGCHEGYMTFKLSTVVGDKGKVYAVDVEQNKLEKLKTNQKKRNITNIIAIKGEYDNPRLQLNSLDAGIILDTYHEIEEHDKVLQHIKASLKPGGRLVLCEPIADERRKSNRQDQERKHELGMNFAIEDLKEAGFTIIKQQDPFIDRTKEKGDKMWLIVAIKK
ncbi:MAG: methyltransferase domain-containing protein [Bacteroidota bacterium]